VADSVRRLALLALLGAVAASLPTSASAASLLLADHALLALAGDDGAALVRAQGGRLVSAELRLWRVDTRTALTLAPELGARLRYAEPDLVRAPAVLPSDPLTVPEIGYHLYRIGADRVEPPATGYPLTVIDTGLLLSHQEFAGRPNLAPLNDQSVRNPNRVESYHGTIVASTAAAPVDGIGAAGVNPNAPLRVWDAGELSDASVIAGVEAAIAAGPSVINLSLGGVVPSRALLEAVLRAVESGSLVVAASGNERTKGDPPLFPASYPHVLTVGSSDPSDRASGFSSSSPGLDLVAPGETIPVQNPADAGYRSFTGTSFAAPQVAAAAAWVQTLRPELTVTQLFEVMRLSARDIEQPGYDARSGYGILDIPAALARPAPEPDPQEPNDDVDQVLANRVFRLAKPAINGPRGGPASLAARLDTGDDRHDVYRLVVPARRQLVVTIAAADTVHGLLTAPSTRTLATVNPPANTNLSRAGRTVRLTFANRGPRAAPLLAAVNVLAEAPGREVSYRLAVAVRALPPARP
jgi:hypothetical protein